MKVLPSHTGPDADSSPSSTSPTMYPQNNCRLFKLPAELRNAIYVYVFNGSAPARRVKMRAATKAAPRIDVALICRRIYSEAVGLHQSSYSNFWTNNTFAFIDKLTYDKKRITAKHVDHMRHITIEGDFEDSEWEDGCGHITLHLAPIRPLPLDGLCWKFSIAGSDRSVVQNQFDGVEMFCDGFLREHLDVLRKVLVQREGGRTKRCVPVDAPNSHTPMCDLDKILEDLRSLQIHLEDK